MTSTCKNCGNEFIRNHHHQRHCTSRCRDEYKYKRYKERHEGKWPHRKYLRTCEVCNETFYGWRPVAKYCSKKCSGLASRKYLTIPDCLENPDRKLDKNIGYVRVYVPMHPEANSWGYVYEHRVIAEQVLGRRLEPNEVVHHRNRKRWDNSPDNLEVMDRCEHSKLHTQ